MTTGLQPAHASYGASNCKGWTSCGAYIRMAKAAPPSFDTQYSREGKVAHALLEDCLQGYAQNASVDDASALASIGRSLWIKNDDGSLEQVVITAETARCVQTALDHIFMLLDTDRDSEVFTEERVEVPSSVVPGMMWGTCDVRVYQPNFRALHVIDYKHGVGIYVDEVDNMQLKFYALAATMMSAKPIDTVTMTIIQPRSFQLGGAVRSDTTTPAALLDFLAFLDQAAEVSLDPDAPFNPNADYCRWCPAASICPAYEAYSLTATGARSINELSTTALPPPKTLPIDRLAYIMQAEPMISSWLRACKDVAVGAALAGYDLPGFKIVAGKAQRAWYGKPEDIAATMALLTGHPVERFFPNQLITLTEAEKDLVDAFRGGVQKGAGETRKAYEARKNAASEAAHEAMAALTLKEPRGKIALVPISDPRPRLDPVASNFANIKIEPPPEG